MTNKKLSLNLSNTDMSTIGMLEAFYREAKHEEWGYLEIEKFVDEATSYDYDHLVKTLSSICRSN